VWLQEQKLSEIGTVGKYTVTVGLMNHDGDSRNLKDIFWVELTEFSD
jgi:hypothetical protein